MREKRPYEVTVETLKLLFTCGSIGVLQHEICLHPQNANSVLPKLWDMELIESKRLKLMGNYIKNWEAQPWNNKNVWEVTVETTMDLLYLIQKSYSRDIVGKRAQNTMKNHSA